MHHLFLARHFHSSNGRMCILYVNIDTRYLRHTVYANFHTYQNQFFEHASELMHEESRASYLFFNTQIFIHVSILLRLALLQTYCAVCHRTEWDMIWHHIFFTQMGTLFGLPFLVSTPHFPYDEYKKI